MCAAANAGGGAGGAGGGGSTPSNRNPLHSPPLELPSSNAQNFFEEAKITPVEEAELRRKFRKFCRRSGTGDSNEEDLYLTLDSFCRMLQYYECASAQHFESYFHAIDRNSDDRLDFQEFFLGCCAADPSTVHILNSFTGLERSQYIFDFYDTNRSGALEFDEFARLTADCLSLSSTTAEEEQAIHNQALEKARELGALDPAGTGGPALFASIKFKQFYEFVQNEKLRGTSRLFRFHKSIVKSRTSHHGRRPQGSSSGNSSAGGSTAASVTPLVSGGAGTGHAGGEDGAAEDEIQSDQEDDEWHAHLLDLDSFFDPDGLEPASPAVGSRDRPKPQPPAYLSLLPPAPSPPVRPEADAASTPTEVKALARKVVRSLSTPNFEGVLPPKPSGEVAPFVLLAPGHLRALCSMAIKQLEQEDMVLSNLHPPIKIFGAIHGQLLDLLSHFKWQQAPTEDSGDLLYTTYLFLGDYVDRGAHSLEVMTVLLSLKVIYPHRILLLRGHHECRHLNYHLGLRLECERRLGLAEGAKTFESLNRVFDHMSLAAVISGQVLALGPGVLPASLTRLEQLRRFRKPLTLPHASQPRSQQPAERLNEQLLVELFTPGSLLPRELGSTREEVTTDQVRVFCGQHRVAAVLRSRHIPARGFAFECGGRLITITSVINYCDLPAPNDAAILCVTKEEGSSNLRLRPKVVTGKVGKLYGLLGSGTATTSGRWPTQTRSATPGRASGQSKPPAGTDPETGVGGDTAAVVIAKDHGLTADVSATLRPFPAIRFGRGAASSSAAKPGLSESAAIEAAPRDDWGQHGGGSQGRSLQRGASDLWRNNGPGPVAGAALEAGSTTPTQRRSATHSPSGAASEAAQRNAAGAAGGGTPSNAARAHVASSNSGAQARVSSKPPGGTTVRGDNSASALPAGTGAAPADAAALALLLEEAPRLSHSVLPAAPSEFLRTCMWPAEQPLLHHLCRIWIEAGWSDREWSQALLMFDSELKDQPRQQVKVLGRVATGGMDGDLGESRWSLETFSMWLLKRGRRLRDCSQWFRAFDFDQDELIGIADFLQGLVASAAPRSPEPSSPGGLCTALAVFRLLDLEKRQGLDIRSLESLFADAQVSLSGTDLALPLSVIAQQATDFEFFRSLLLPRLQNAPAFRLRVFGNTQTEAP